jgi:hypothetical protein
MVKTTDVPYVTDKLYHIMLYRIQNRSSVICEMTLGLQIINSKYLIGNSSFNLIRIDEHFFIAT